MSEYLIIIILNVLILMCCAQTEKEAECVFDLAEGGPVCNCNYRVGVNINYCW